MLTGEISGLIPACDHACDHAEILPGCDHAVTTVRVTGGRILSEANNVKARITKRFLDGVEIPQKGRLRIFDVTMTGFGVTILPSGRKSFFITYGPETRRKQLTLGRYGNLTVTQARKIAQRHLSQIADGADPMEERLARREVPSVSEWVEEYMKAVCRRKKQPQHDRRYLGMLTEKWGRRPVDELSRRELKAEMEIVAARGHTTANRWLASVRSCLETAKRDGLISENPAMGVRP